MKIIEATKFDPRSLKVEPLPAEKLSYEQELIVAGTRTPADASGLEYYYATPENPIARTVEDGLAVNALNGAQMDSNLNIGPDFFNDSRSLDEKVFTPRQVTNLPTEPKASEGIVYYHQLANEPTVSTKESGTSHVEAITTITVDPEYAAAKAGLRRITTLLLTERVLGKKNYL